MSLKIVSTHMQLVTHGCINKTFPCALVVDYILSNVYAALMVLFLLTHAGETADYKWLYKQDVQLSKLHLP